MSLKPIFMNSNPRLDNVVNFLITLKNSKIICINVQKKQRNVSKYYILKIYIRPPPLTGKSQWIYNRQDLYSTTNVLVIEK